jgi:uncharacterized sulfatase
MDARADDSRSLGSQRATARPSGQAAARLKLNVLMIIVDDLNPTCIGCYGPRPVKTPNIDGLASRGARFERAYCQFPYCGPSRASLFSGRRPETTKVFGNNTDPRTHLPGVLSLQELFRKHGYFTGGAGKVGFDDKQSWVRHVDSFGKLKLQALLNRPSFGPMEWLPIDAKDEETPDGRKARFVAELLEKHKDEPFFLALGLHKPHPELVAPRPYFAMYPPEAIALPQGLRPETNGAEVRQAIAAYYACTTFMDAQVGFLLQTLDRLGLRDNTVVIFTADHGWMLGEHGKWAKRIGYDEAVRVPLIAAVPGKKGGLVSPRLVELVDLYPTLTELCGLPQPGGLEGTSFVPLLDDPQQAWKKAAFSRTGKEDGSNTVRTERYSYQAGKLFDLRNDPQEFNNLATDPSHSATVAEMQRLLKDGWRAALPPARATPQ